MHMIALASFIASEQNFNANMEYGIRKATATCADSLMNSSSTGFAFRQSIPMRPMRIDLAHRAFVTGHLRLWRHITTRSPRDIECNRNGLLLRLAMRDFGSDVRGDRLAGSAFDERHQ